MLPTWAEVDCNSDLRTAWKTANAARKLHGSDSDQYMDARAMLERMTKKIRKQRKRRSEADHERPA